MQHIRRLHLKILYLIPLLLLTSSYQLVTDYRFVNPVYPIHLDTELREVGKASFSTPSVRDTYVDYEDAHAFLYYSHFLNPDNALSWEAGYSFLDFKWPQNPLFKGTHYHFANASLAWISTAIPRWRWILSAATSVDAQEGNFEQTGVYYGLMWGRYRLAHDMGLHLGWAGYVGVKNGYFLPILGIDWRMSPCWQCNAIFPLNFSIQYFFNACWSAAAEITSFGRPYRFPIRAKGGIGAYENGIFEIYSKGMELNVTFGSGGSLSASAGAGWNSGGWILIKDHENHHGTYYKHGGAPYAQGKLSLTF